MKKSRWDASEEGEPSDKDSEKIGKGEWERNQPSNNQQVKVLLDACSTNIDAQVLMKPAPSVSQFSTSV